MALFTRNPDNRVTGSDFLGTLSLVEVFFDFFLAEPWRMRFEETILKTINELWKSTGNNLVFGPLKGG